MEKELKVIEERELLGKQFRIYGTFEEPLFLAKDVAEWIDYSKNSQGKYNVTAMISTVNENEKLVLKILIPGDIQKRNVIMLTEDGLYEVLMQSQKPIAKQFKKEVKKILKQIRQTGGYIPTNEEDDDETIMAKALIIAQKTIERKNKIIQEQQPKVKYYENVLNPTDFKKLITITQIAKDLGTTATKLNKMLKDLGIQYKKSKTWFLNKQYDYLIKEGYTDYEINEFGQTLKWTEKGRQFIIDKLNENNYLNSNGTF